jgi:hypothetical protein
MTRTFTIDGTEPETYIEAKPANPTNSLTATFNVSSSETGSTFECRLDGGSFSSCSSPKSYSVGAGDHTFEVWSTDPAGNVDSTPESYIWTVDTTGPSLSISEPDPTSTRSGPVTYTVTYTGADTITLAAGDVSLNATGTATGTVAVSGSGSDERTVTISSITGDGTLGITIAAGTAFDGSGNLVPASTPSATFTADNVAPVVSISNPSPTVTKSGPVTYTVNYTGADTVTLVAANVTLNTTGNATGTIAVTGSGSATRTVTISAITGNGTLGITIAAGTASDNAGNTAPASTPSATFTVDNTKPTPTIDSKPANPSSSTDADFAFHSNEAGTFTCQQDSQPILGCTSPVHYSGLAAGLQTFTLTAIDLAGNSRSVQYSWFIDLTPPVVTITQPISPNPTNSSATVRWSADTSGAYSIRVGGTSCVDGTVAVSGSYTTPNVIDTLIAAANLGEGPNTVRVCVTDAAGNKGSTTGSVVKDSVAPALSISGPSATLTKSGPVTYTVTYTGADAVRISNRKFRKVYKRKKLSFPFIKKNFKESKLNKLLLIKT